MIEIDTYAGLALSLMPMTTNNLRLAMKLSRSRVCKTLLALKAAKLTHVSHYDKTKDANAPVYAAGSGMDAAYPQKTIKVKAPLKPVKEPKLPFKLPERCQPKIKILMPNSPYRTVWVKGHPFAEVLKCGNNIAVARLIGNPVGLF